jgi:alpha-L-rhamnosidase
MLAGIAGFVAVLLLQSEPVGASASSEEAAAPEFLRCEYLVDPLGIDRTSPRLFWKMVDGRRGALQRAYQILVADAAELLSQDVGNLWDSGVVASEDTIHVVYAGKALRSRMEAFWKVRIWDDLGRVSAWSRVARWSMGLLEPGDWQAQWIEASEEDLAEAQQVSGPRPAPMLRRRFDLKQSPERLRRAVIYVTALGLYELRVNGQRVGERVLAPEWTDYHKRIQYQTYEVRDLLVCGENVVGVILGDGWYAGRIGLANIVPDGRQRGIYGLRPRLLLQLEIEGGDGDRQVILTDAQWRATTEGPIRAADLLDGETYDARRELPGWDCPGFDDSNWKPVRVVTAPAAKLVAQPNEPIRVIRRLAARSVAEPAPGVFIFDFGQNLAGWCRVRLRGPAGAMVTLRHGEALNEDGTLYTANLRSAAQTDRYILSGKAEEIFEPHFTYHGFRYVELTGLRYRPEPGDIEACVVHSAAREVGRFACSDPLLEKLIQNIVWTLRANLMSIPTDCPQRDERLGWMGDILVFAQTACFSMDLAAFFTKWVADVRDAQTEDGRYGDFAPHPFDPAARFSAAPGWGDAGVFVPWCVYTNYADTRLLQEHFESARRWVDFIHRNNPELVWRTARGNDYGDWLNGDTLEIEGWPRSGAAVPKDVFATMFFAQSAELTARMAGVLGRGKEARHYGRLASEIRAAFEKSFVDAEGRIAGNTQTGYALALHLGMLSQPMQSRGVEHLVAALEAYGGRLSTGFHGTLALLQALTRAGQVETAYRLVRSRSIPSWGYQIEHGATTTWERWDGYVEGRGFANPGMNSFAHYAFGAVGEWIYRNVVGINPDEADPGWRHIVIRPYPGGGLTWAEGAIDSIRGLVSCRWEREASEGALTLEVQIPPGTRATVAIPATEQQKVLEGDGPAEEAEGVRWLRRQGDRQLYRVVSGRYRFRVVADQE